MASKRKVKKFVAIWTEEGFVESHQSIVSDDFFSEDKGYSPEDIRKINSLAIDKKWVCPFYGNAHRVIRIF